MPVLPPLPTGLPTVIPPLPLWSAPLPPDAVPPAFIVPPLPILPKLPPLPTGCWPPLPAASLASDMCPGPPVPHPANANAMATPENSALVCIRVFLTRRRNARDRYFVLVTLSMTTPWLGTEEAVYESSKLPRSVCAHRSRTVAAPVGMPSALHCTVTDALLVPRLKSATARVFVPDSVFDHTCRFAPGEAITRPWIPSGS